MAWVDATGRWHGAMPRVDGTGRCHGSMARVDGTGRWHGAMARVDADHETEDSLGRWLRHQMGGDLGSCPSPATEAAEAVRVTGTLCAVPATDAVRITDGPEQQDCIGPDALIDEGEHRGCGDDGLI